MNNLVLVCYPVHSVSDLAIPLKNHFDNIISGKIMRILLNEVAIKDYFENFFISIYVTTLQRLFDEVGQTKKHKANLELTYSIDNENGINLKITACSENKSLIISVIDPE